MFVNRYQP